MKIIVLHWPERAASLVDRRFRSTAIVATLDKVGERLPEEWLNDAEECRIVTGSRVSYRPVSLEGSHLDELFEAAKYSVEPTLPLPLTELSVSAFQTGRVGRSREIMVTALPVRNLEEIRAWFEKISENKVPLTWAGPPIAVRKPAKDERVRGEGWAAIASEGRWMKAQAARTGDDAARALDKDAQWSSWDAKKESAAAASATDGSWISRPPSRRRRITSNWPLYIAGLALLLIAIAFGLRIAAAERRISAATKSMKETFESALPGIPANMPREQIQVRLRDQKARHDLLKGRIEKTGSAVDVLMIIENAAADPPNADTTSAGKLVLNDIRVNASEFTLIGSGAGVDRIQAFAEKMKANLSVDDPDIRRSPAGLGFDFTIHGTVAKSKEEKEEKEEK